MISSHFVDKASLSWVFDKRSDLLVFPITTVLAIIAGLLWPEARLGFFAFVFVEEIHSFTTMFFTFGSKHQFSRMGRTYLTFLCLSFLVFGGLYFAEGKMTALKVFVLITIFHFARQQAAWFHIAGAKSNTHSMAPSLERLINQIGIGGAIWGPVLIFMSEKEPVGWYIEGDVVQLPNQINSIVVALTAASAALFVGYHMVQWMRGHARNWIQLLMWLNAGVIWTMGLQLEIAFVIAAAHTVPYLYLSYAYVEDRARSGEAFYFPKLSPQWLASLIIVFAGFLAILEWYTRAWIFWVWASVASTHYLLDGVFWKKSRNPEGREFFDRPRPKILSTSESALGRLP